ncbi:MAG: terpene cyclase/mutase family protein [Planctomycetota bacterium]|nr:terpene cyclase/mutase family protein [Planctomycetota bacterium]
MFRIAWILALCMVAWPVLAVEVDATVTAAAARKAAEYLMKQQNENGTFGKGPGAVVPGQVGLVVKGLASSPDKLRENNTAIAKAVKYLLKQQQPSGAISIPDMGIENYNTSVVVVALVALENPAYKEVLEKAKKFIMSCQLDEELGYNPKEHTRAYGGFGYGNSKRADLSNTAFSLEALKALGLDEKSPAWKNAVLFIKRCQDNDETNDAAEMKGGDNTGGFVYLPGDSEAGKVKTRSGKELPKPYGNMTYQAVKSLIYAGVKQDDPALQAAFKWIKNNYSLKEQPGGIGKQGYFYYLIAFAKAFTAAGVKDLELADGRKASWAKDLAAQLISLQKEDGSFVNDADKWWESDPVLTTAYALDALNLCTDALKK